MKIYLKCLYCFGLFLFHYVTFGQNSLREESVGDAVGRFSVQSLKVPNNQDMNALKWKVELGAGVVTGPYVGQLKQLFKAANLQGCINSFFGQTCFPKNTSAVGYSVSIGRDIANILSIGATVNHTSVGGVEGMRGRFGASAWSFAPEVTIQIPKTWWVLGAGPCYHLLNVKFSDLGSLIETVHHKKVGLLVDIGIVVPARAQVFGKLNLRYLYLGNIETQQYEISDPFVSSGKITIPSSSISFNQFLFSLGFGFRI